MNRYFLRALAARLRTGRALLLLSLFGVALGVASVLSIQIISHNALAAFEGAVEAVSGEADFSIISRTPAMSESLYPTVLAQRGVAGAWVVNRADVVLAGRSGLVLQIIGLDFFASRRIPWKTPPTDLAAALGRPGWIALSPAMARSAGLGVGDPFEVTSGSRRARLVVGALVDFQRLTPLASSRLAVMDIAQHQSLFGSRGEILQIDVRAAEGADRAQLMQRLRRALGPGVEVVTPEQRKRQTAGLLGAFRLNLTALSLISLFVGSFLVYSSTQAALVRRRHELGLLRSLGTTRGQVVAVIMGEVFLMGLVGVALGLPLGWLVARLNVETVSATLSNLYLLSAIEQLQLPTRLYVVAALVGVAGAFAGAVLPAVEISRKETRSLLAPFTLHERIRAAALPLFVSGWGLLAATWVAYLVAGSRWRPAGFAVGIAILLAMPLLTPFTVGFACRLVRSRGLGFGYGLRSLARRLQTTAAIAALAVAVSMLVGITLMIGSFRRTVDIWARDTIRADIYVSTESWRRGRREATIRSDLVASLAAHPGITAIDRQRQFLSSVREADGRRIAVAGVDLGGPGGPERFALVSGDAGTALQRALEDGGVMIGEPLALKAGLDVGDRVSLFTPGGEREFPVTGVYYDYASEFGSVTMDLATMERWFGPGSVNNLALYLEPGRDSERTVDELEARFADEPLVFRSNRRLRRNILSIFDQTFAITRLLRAMGLVIAAAGITLTLLVLAREQTSELALYRALGAMRWQIFRVFLGKGMAMAIIGLVMGAIGGVALAMVLIFLINRAYFGWTIAVHWPLTALAREGAVILLAAALASLYPALRASRTPATELSRDDL